MTVLQRTSVIKIMQNSHYRAFVLTSSSIHEVLPWRLCKSSRLTRWVLSLNSALLWIAKFSSHNHSTTICIFFVAKSTL